MIIIGLLLIPVSVAVIRQLNKFNIRKKTKKILNAYLWISSIIYVTFSFAWPTEPFIFEITRAGDYLLYSTEIFIFSPFLWINLYYFCKKMFRSIRVHKNAKIKSSEEYIYYRDDLNKISPTMVMFTSTMDTDVKKSVSATILKLKLNGYIQEINNKLKCTNKKDNELLDSEKIVLRAIKTNYIDEALYKNVIEKETLDYKYLRRNNSAKFMKIMKIIVIATIPVILIILSTKFDSFVFGKYKTYIYAGKRYVSVNNGEIGDIHFDNIDNIDDYYHGYIEEDGYKQIFYDKALIRANKYDNSFVLKTAILQNLDLLFVVLSDVLLVMSIYMIIEQIMYFNKNYARTKKGTELLRKAYALKNYLREYSLIQEKNEEELVLWENYLVYSVILDINMKVKDSIIEKYMKDIVIK